MKERVSTTAKQKQDVFEQSMDMLCTASADGYFVHINPRWEQVLDIVSWFGAQLFPDTRAAVYLVPPSGDSLDKAASWNGYAGGERLQPGDCWTLRRSQAHRYLSGAPARCAHMPDDVEGSLTEHYCIPMTAYGTWLGLITFAFDMSIQSATIEQLHGLAKTVADQFGLALSGLQLREKLRTLSI